MMMQSATMQMVLDDELHDTIGGNQACADFFSGAMAGLGVAAVVATATGLGAGVGLGLAGLAAGAAVAGLFC